MNERPKSPSEILQEVLNNETAKKPLSEIIAADEKGPLLDQLIKEIDITQRTERKR